jgi:hypothetical protein
MSKMVLDKIDTNLKIVLEAFLLILIPAYWYNYGFANFLWLSDIGLFLTFIGLAYKSRLAMSMAFVGVFLYETAWFVDFIYHLMFGKSILNIVDYMFDPSLAVWLRGLSLFHLVTPWIWLYYAKKWGYKPKAIYYFIVLFWLDLIAVYLFSSPSENINWVFMPNFYNWRGFPPFLWLILVMILVPLFLFWPTHHLAMRFFKK